MIQMERDEFGIEEFAKSTNGKIEGLRLALTIFVLSSQSEDKVKSYVNSLSFTKDTIEEKIRNGEYQFDSKWYPDATLSMLNKMIEYLSDTKPEKASNDNG